MTAGVPATRPQTGNDRHQEMYAGIALFFSMYYILGVNPEILALVDVPVSVALTGTFLAIILGNLLGVSLTGKGLLIAPAVGISSFVVAFVQASNPQGLPGVFGWVNAFAACGIAGFLVFLTSWKLKHWREDIVQALPESVRNGTKAAIGSLLVSKATDIFKVATSTVPADDPAAAVAGSVGHACREVLDGKPSHLDPDFGYVIALAVAAIVTFHYLRSKRAARTTRTFVDFLLRTELVVVVVVLSFLLHWFEKPYINSLPAHTRLSFLWTDSCLRAHWRDYWRLDFPSLILMGILAVTVWFIIMTDIPGTPPEVLREDMDPAERKTAVERGYLADGVAAFFAPLFGTTPTIYYAENQILKEFNVYSRGAGFWAIGCFMAYFAVAIALQFFPESVWSLPRLIPPIAALPVLFFIGLYIIALSFLPKDEPAAPKPKRSLEYFLPTAISVILTPQIGLEYAFPLSIISYWAVGHDGEPIQRPFKLVTVGAVISLGLTVLMHFSRYFSN